MIDLKLCENFLNENEYFFIKYVKKGLIKENIKEYTTEFNQAYSNRPINDNKGGIGEISSFWIFVISKFINPSLIIESGVWKGHSSWLLRKSNPNAKLHCFDINLKNLKYKDASINYHKKDWKSFKFGSVNSQRSLVYFDDHINLAKRVKQAYKKGFKYLIFDDNLPVERVKDFGRPAIPTISILFNNKIKYGEIFEWELEGKLNRHKYKRRDTFGVKKIIQDHIIFPGTPCYLTLVILI